MAVSILVFLVGLAALLGVQGDIRARDPEMEDEPVTVPEHGGWDRVIPGVFGGARRRSGTPGFVHHHHPLPPQGHGLPQSGAGPALHPRGHRPPLSGTEEHQLQVHGPPLAPRGLPEEVSPTGEAGLHHPTRAGNWCTYVAQQVVMTPVTCGTEKYTIKSQSPCPNGTPDCQLVMYKLSTRPLYRQQQRVVTAILWRCCNGYGGHDCEDRDRDGLAADPGHPTTGSGLPGPSATRRTGAERLLSQPAGDQTWEQNDFQRHRGPPFERRPTNTEPSAAAFTSVSHQDLSGFDRKPGSDHDPEADYDHDLEWDEDQGHDQDHGQNPHRNHDHDQDQSPHGNHDHDQVQNPHSNRDHDQDQDHGQDQDRMQTPHRNHDHDQDQTPHRSHDHDQVQTSHHNRDHDQDQDRGQNPHRNHDHDQDQNPHRNRDHDQDQNPHRNHEHDEDQTSHSNHDHNQNPHHNHDQNPHHNHDQDQNPHPNHDHDQDQNPHPNHDHNHEDRQHNQHLDHGHGQTGPGGVDIKPGSSPFPDAPQLPSLPLLMKALMAQLGPVLDGFNRTLERLSHQVGGLSQDLARLKQEREGHRGEGVLEGPGPGVGEGEGGGGGDFETKLEESFYQLDQVREELKLQRAELEDRMHSQQAMLHYNLTNFKTDTDGKIKRSQKMIQVNLHSINASLTEVRQKQEQLEAEVQGGGGPHHGQLVEGPAVWDAIRRLDGQVVNNTVKVNALAEDLDLTTENIRDLQRGYRGLEDRIVQTGRDSQIQFMETGLEVEAAKVVVLDRIQELANNLTLQDEQLKDMDSDMDYLYTQLYRINGTSRDCDCKALGAGLAQLERQVANVSKAVEENRLGLEEYVEGQDRWDVGGDTAVEDLREGLLQVKQSLAFEQDKSRVLHLNISQLQASHLASQRDVSDLQESDRRKVVEIKRLGSSFSSLLKDAIRHTEVLEVLLGEEVLEFKDRPVPAQQEYSIPALRDRIQQTLVQIKHQNLSLTLLWKAAQEADLAVEDPALGVSEPGFRGLRRRSKDPLEEEDNPDALMGDRPDYSVSDFWSLGKEVEDLNAKVSRLEEQRCVACCNCTKDAAPGGAVEELQSEVSLLRRGLENHLRVFKDVFSDMDVLAGSEGTLELDKLWALVKRKEEKKRRRLQKGKKAESGESHGGQRVDPRNKRDVSPETAALNEIRDAAPVMFLASTDDGARRTGAVVVFERALLNHGATYSAETGTFRAPAPGVYLFAMTVDFGPGPSLVRLKRGEATAATLRQGPGEPAGPLSRLCLLPLEKGEQLRLELSEGMVRSGVGADNTFAGLLLFRDT